MPPARPIIFYWLPNTKHISERSILTPYLIASQPTVVNRYDIVNRYDVVNRSL